MHRCVSVIAEFVSQISLLSLWGSPSVAGVWSYRVKGGKKTKLAICSYM